MRRRSLEERRALVEEWSVSGETIRVFCDQKGIAVESFKRWKKKTCEPPTEGVSFLPVMLAPARHDTRRATPCRILVGGGIVLECAADTDFQAIEMALRAAVTICGLNSAV